MGSPLSFLRSGAPPPLVKLLLDFDGVEVYEVYVLQTLLGSGVVKHLFNICVALALIAMSGLLERRQQFLKRSRQSQWLSACALGTGLSNKAVVGVANNDSAWGK